jgi:dihydropteroate synthase
MSNISTNYPEPIIMGILNMTPDSFSDGGKYTSVEVAFDEALKMIEQGAKIIDVGGESTRPGSAPISLDQELARVLPIVQCLCLLKNSDLDGEPVDFKISVDTTKPAVARASLELGADIINDVTGMTNPKMREVVAEFGCTVVIMHMQGRPKTMQNNPNYTDSVLQIKEFFEKQIATCKKEGISQIIIDPGIGFGKSLEHNLQIIKHLDQFKIFGQPILFGASRKSFIQKALDLPLKEREEATQTANVMAFERGAQIFRVHQVKSNFRALQMAHKIVSI